MVDKKSLRVSGVHVVYHLKEVAVTGCNIDANALPHRAPPPLLVVETSFPNKTIGNHKMTYARGDTHTISIVCRCIVVAISRYLRTQNLNVFSCLNKDPTEVVLSDKAAGPCKTVGMAVIKVDTVSFL